MKNRIIFYIIALVSISVVQGRILDDQHCITDIMYTLNGATGPLRISCLKKASIYKVEDGTRIYIVRFTERYATPYRVNEFNIHSYAAKNDFGPSILFHDTKQGILVMEYLESQAPIENVDQAIPLFVKSLHKMHHTPFTERQMVRFIDFIPRKIVPSDENWMRDLNIHELYEKLLRLKWLFENTEENVLIHGDLHPFNIFMSQEKCFFIDFETARVDNVFVDLAHITLCYGMSKQEEKKLLELYFNRSARTIDFIKLTAMKCFVCAKIIRWMLESLDAQETFASMYIPTLKEFVKQPHCIENSEWRYAFAMSAVKEVEELFAQLDLCMIGDYSGLLPTGMQPH